MRNLRETFSSVLDRCEVDFAFISFSDGNLAIAGQRFDAYRILKIPAHAKGLGTCARKPHAVV